MKYVECPAVYDGEGQSVFLAGGISGCSDWQKKMVELLKNEDLVLINPRRAEFDVDDSVIEEAQIKWEFDHLNLSNAILFWFPSETVCPITLYELGKISMTDKKLFVGVHPDYSRKNDVVIQTGLARPDVQIVFSLEELAERVRSELK